MNAPTLPVSNVVNVRVEMSPKTAALRNFGACLIVGSSDVIDTHERIRTYSDIQSIAEDFGSTSPEFYAARAFFSQVPKPTQVQVARWAKTATSGLIRGRMLSTEQQKMTAFTGISNGAFDVTIDSSLVNVTAVNLAGQSNLNGVASQISAKLSARGTCVWNGTAFVIKSNTTGLESKVTGVTDTELSRAMGLADGVSQVDGIGAETLTDCFAQLLDFTTWYMAFLAAPHEDEEVLGASGIIEAASPARILAVTSSDTQELDGTQSESLGAKLSEHKYNRTMCVYSSTDAYAGASVLGRMSTVNFEGSNTCLTLKFKQCPGVVPESLRTSQDLALKKHNVNVFAKYQNDTAILQEGVMAGGWFIDEVHGLDWLQNRVETDLWNLFYVMKKVGQEETGADNLVAEASKALEQGVKNGLIAPGIWNGDSFGSLQKGDTLSTGYYVYIMPFDEQSQSDRDARKAPPLQIAVKLKGAVHFVDVTITVNR